MGVPGSVTLSDIIIINHNLREAEHRQSVEGQGLMDVSFTKRVCMPSSLLITLHTPSYLSSDQPCKTDITLSIST